MLTIFLIFFFVISVCQINLHKRKNIYYFLYISMDYPTDYNYLVLNLYISKNVFINTLF